jgi:hypothetical protein
MSFRSRTLSTIRRFHLERPTRLLLGSVRRTNGFGHRAVEIGRRATRAIRRLPSTMKLASEYRRLLRRRIPLETLLGTPQPEAIAIVVCLWNRPERLEEILDIVARQQTSKPLRLVLWNNQPRFDGMYRMRLNASQATGSLRSIEWFTSPWNVGGIGRFLAQRELVRAGYRGPFIMMDDDQDFSPDFVEDLLAQAGEKTVAGVWAWKNDGAYWNRTQVRVTGTSADHVGTGGSVCDSTIVRDEAFFEAIPSRFLFMEDMWMSQYARRNDWTLKMVDSPFNFVLSELDQGHALFDRKENFFSWMKGPGHVPVTESS